MNREDIIRMAQEAQMPFYWRTGEITYLDKLERFAVLVATNDTSQKRVDKTSESVHEEQRTWVGLTDEEIKNACDKHTNWFAIAFDLEAKLKEKNA